MRVMVFSAHSADFCSRAGGTIAKLTRDGADVKVVSLSYGERSESGGLYTGNQSYTLEEIRRIRHEEATAAAEILGAEIVFLDWGDFGFSFTPERAKELVHHIRAFKPDAILTHHGPDPVSVDHDSTYLLSRRATQMAGAPGLESEYAPHGCRNIFMYEATIPLTEVEGFNPDFYIDVSDVWPIKVKALEAFHRAQGFLLPWYTDVAKRRAFQASRLRRGPIEYAEAFERAFPWVGDHLPL